MKKFFFILIASFPFISNAQSDTTDVAQLKQQILLLQMDVDNIQVNLATSQDKFKRGIAIATIGYTVTIIGGLMLGRENDDLGKVLLIGGGITGVTGTIMLVDAFKYLGRAGRKSSQKSNLNNRH